MKLDKNNPCYRYYLKEFWLRSFDFKGKTIRNDFWLAYLFNFLIALILFIFGWLVYVDTKFIGLLLILPNIYLIGSIVPNISIQIRRLRDIGVEPLYILLSFIPLVNLVLLFWYLQPSNSYDQNKLKTKVSNEEIRLEDLKSMLDRNIISEEEYKSMRKKTLGL